MTAVQSRVFELISTVTFHDMNLSEVTQFAPKLTQAIREVLPEYPAVNAFLVEVDQETADVNFGLRFSAIDPDAIEDIASEILHEAVGRIAAGEGSRPVEAEREDSVLLLAQ